MTAGRSFVPVRSVNGKWTRTIFAFIYTALSGPIRSRGRVHFQEIWKGSTLIVQPGHSYRAYLSSFAGLCSFLQDYLLVPAMLPALSLRVVVCRTGLVLRYRGLCQVSQD